MGALVLALFFVADDEVTWREDDAGRVTIENAGKSLMQADPQSREVRFLSLFERRFVPVEPERADKIVTLLDFFLRRRLEPGDEIALDYPLKARTYRIDARAVSRGEFKLPAVAEEALPCTRVTGLITGWGEGRQTAIEAYVGREGEFEGKVLCISFKFTDWPKVTLTLAGCKK